MRLSLPSIFWLSVFSTLAKVTSTTDWLWQPPQYLKGIGPKKAGELKARGIEDVYDLLNFLPKSYRDYRNVTPLAQAQHGVEASFRVRVVKAPFKAKGRRFYRATVEDDSGTADVFWFGHQLHGPAHDLKQDDVIWLVGKPDRKKLTPAFSHPKVFSDFHKVEIEPTYRGIPWLSSGIRRAVASIAENLSQADPIGAELRQTWDVPGWGEAFAEIHAPDDSPNLNDVFKQRSRGYRRVAADAFFAYFLGMGLRRRALKQIAAARVQIAEADMAAIVGALPFGLTGDQRAALDAIMADMAQQEPMYRLVQGDVGSGKTAVALVAAAAAAKSGGQAVILAPTEILAGQHARFFDTVLAGLGIRIARLTGSLSPVRRKEIKFMAEKGAVDIVIGTHALLQDDVNFADLRLVVIDEEQRYGVMQRTALRSKGGAPHTLQLTATPIPRSLALSLLGETAVTTIREKPAGRADVKTDLVPEAGKRRVLEHIRAELGLGHKVFFIYPRVDESETTAGKSVEEMYKRLSDYFGADKVGLLHGRMPGEEKDRMLRHMREGRIAILVATTVVEVGVDIPDATILVIGGADAFGLSQLHQIRGRIGRGQLPGTCYVLLDDDMGEEALARLDAFAKTNDGFEIAEADLELRGPGSIVGTRQSGMPDIHPVLLRRFSSLAKQVRQDAERVLDDDPQLLAPVWAPIREILRRKWDVQVGLGVL